MLYFILGILLVSLGLPVLEALSSIISSWSEYVVYSFAFKIYKVKKEMGLDDEEEEEEEKQILGFTSVAGDYVPG